MSGIEVLTPRWPAPPAIRALSTLRTGGVSGGEFASLNLGDHVGDKPADVAENRRRLREHCELPGDPRWLRQVHGVAVADLDDSPALMTADAALTRRAGVVCAILTADCLPVLFADDTGGCVAAAHAGWRGLLDGVLEATVAAMATPPARLLGWLGPAIGPQRFEVGDEVRAAFVARDPAAAAAFVPHGARHLADLAALARQRLAAAGVMRVFGGGECTHSQPQRFFSHRRDGRGGRQATLIWKA
jgi:polyphenol oxidase